MASDTRRRQKKLERRKKKAKAKQRPHEARAICRCASNDLMPLRSCTVAQRACFGRLRRAAADQRAPNGRVNVRREQLASSRGARQLNLADN